MWETFFYIFFTILIANRYIWLNVKKILENYNKIAILFFNTFIIAVWNARAILTIFKNSILFHFILIWWIITNLIFQFFMMVKVFTNIAWIFECNFFFRLKYIKIITNEYSLFMNLYSVFKKKIFKFIPTAKLTDVKVSGLFYDKEMRTTKNSVIKNKMCKTV